MALSTMISAGGLMNIQSAKVDATVCPPGAQCAPSGGMHKQGGSDTQGTPPVGSNQTGQEQSGSMDWKKRHRDGNQGGDQTGQNQSGNMDWRHRHRGNDSGVGVGIYLGDGYCDGYGNGYDNGHYGHRHYANFVSCGEAGGIVRDSGFHHVHTESCAPGRYLFIGSKRGDVFEIAVSGRGRIVAVDPA
jgi:hypothetical protein